MRNFINGYVNVLCNNYEAMGQVCKFYFNIMLYCIGVDRSLFHAIIDKVLKQKNAHFRSICYRYIFFIFRFTLI